MLLIPEFPIVEDVFDLKEFKQANRHLIIYKNVNNDFLSDYQFTVINNSVQVGGRNKLAHNETLFCSHFYFGTVDKPFIVNQNGEQILNPNAILIVKEHSYIHKLVQQISDDEKTVNIFDGTYKNEYARYGNTGDMVLPPDIRYYTLDHQILKEHCDTPFGTDERQLEMKARINQGMFYILKEIVDPYTIISFVPIKHYDNPDSLGTKLAMAQILSNKTNNQYIPSEIQSWIIGAITRFGFKKNSSKATMIFLTYNLKYSIFVFATKTSVTYIIIYIYYFFNEDLNDLVNPEVAILFLASFCICFSIFCNALLLFNFASNARCLFCLVFTDPFSLIFTVFLLFVFCFLRRSFFSSIAISSSFSC